MCRACIFSGYLPYLPVKKLQVNMANIRKKYTLGTPLFACSCPQDFLRLFRELLQVGFSLSDAVAALHFANVVKVSDKPKLFRKKSCLAPLFSFVALAIDVSISVDACGDVIRLSCRQERSRSLWLRRSFNAIIGSLRIIGCIVIILFFGFPPTKLLRCSAKSCHSWKEITESS